MTQPILINGKWIKSHASATFRAENPATAQMLTEEYPISDWHDCDAALDAATSAFQKLRACRRKTLRDFSRRTPG